MSDSSTNNIACQHQLKTVAIDTCRENVTHLHRDYPIYRAEDFRALPIVEFSSVSHKVLAVMNNYLSTHVTRITSPPIDKGEEVDDKKGCSYSTNNASNIETPQMEF